MKIPKDEIERAKGMLEDYKERVAKGEKFITWEEVEKQLNFTPEEEAEIEKEEQKIIAKINKKNEKIKRKLEKHSNKSFVKA